MLGATVAANQPVVAIAAPVWLVASRDVVISIRAVGMGSVRSGSVRARTPRVIAVVIAAMPVIVGDIRGITEDDVSPSAAASPTPVHVPGMKAPAEATPDH